jgi:hypothetical protein
VFIVAARNLGANTIAEILFECESGAGDSQASEPQGQGIAGTATTSVGNSGGIGTDCWWDGSDKAATLTVKSNDQRMPDKNQMPLVLTTNTSENDVVYKVTPSANQ